MRPITVAEPLASLAESLTVAVDVKIQERLARGEDIINLGVGQPDFPTPAAIRDSAARAVERGATRYTPPGGTRELRGAAAEFFRARGVPADPANTLVSCGAKHALYEVMVAVLEPGDEVLLPTPYWVTYPEQTKLAGARGVPVSPASGLRVTPEDLERHRSDRTRMLVLNSPNNPSGTLYSRPEVEALVEWCLSRDVLILSDEIYDRFVFDGLSATSPASLGDEVAARTFTVNGVSKTYAMTGWRIGFLTGPRISVEAIVRFQGQTTGNPAAVAQAGALAALTGSQEIVEEMHRTYQRRRDLVVEWLGGVTGVELETPQGAFYAFPRVAEAADRVGGSLALADRLVDAGVGVVPGVGFGADEHLRLSFAVSDEQLAEGVRRFREGLEQVLR